MLELSLNGRKRMPIAIGCHDLAVADNDRYANKPLKLALHAFRNIPPAKEVKLDPRSILDVPEPQHQRHIFDFDIALSHSPHCVSAEKDIEYFHRFAPFVFF
jgi:hypothetical protein